MFPAHEFTKYAEVLAKSCVIRRNESKRNPILNSHRWNTRKWGAQIKRNTLRYGFYVMFDIVRSKRCGVFLQT